MGLLLKEMRTSPIAAVVNGVLGVGGILGVGLLIVLWVTRSARSTVLLQDSQTHLKVTEGSILLYLCLGGLFLLGGMGFLLFALLQITTSTRIFDKGLVWRRFGKKRVVRWVEVAHFGPGDSAAESLTSWRMVLHNGEPIIFHSGLYNRSEFAETMELIAEQIEETHKQIG
jgi:hypothetical protein